MNTGKTLFAQLMASCHGLLSRGSSTGMAAITGSGRFPAPSNTASMAFARYRESLRDIETCLSVHASKRTWASASRSGARRWPTKGRLAMRRCPAAHHPGEDAVRRQELGLDLTNTVYALDSTTIALCLSVFPAHFRTTKAAVKCTRANPQWQAARRSCPRCLSEAGAIYVGSWLRRLCPPLCVAPITLPSRTMLIRHSAPTASTGIGPNGFYTRQDYPELLRRKGPRVRQDAGLHHQQLLASGRQSARYKSRWQVELFFKWIKQHLRIKQFYGTSENARIWIAVSVYVLVAIVKKRLDLDASLYTLLQILSVTLRENAHTSSTCGRRKQMQRFANNQPIEFIRFLTGH